MDSWLRGLGLGLGRGAQASPSAAVDAAVLPSAPLSPPFSSADPLGLVPAHGAATGMQPPRSPAAAVTPPSLQQPPPPQRRTQPAPGTAAALFSAEPSDPASLIGRRVERAFIVNKRTVVYEGVIDRARLLRHRHFGWRWHVSYEDGDDEDIAWQELRDCLVDEADGSGAEQAQALWPHARGGAAAAKPRRVGPDAAAAAAVPAALAAGGSARVAVARAPSAGNGGGAPRSASAVPRAPGSLRFKGVYSVRVGLEKRFRAVWLCGQNQVYVGTFATAVAAAHGYDEAMRKRGRRVVNFPRPGSDEVQAVFGEAEEATLRRLGLPRGRSGVPVGGSKTQHDGTVVAITRSNDELTLGQGIVAQKRTQSCHDVRLDEGKRQRVDGDCAPSVYRGVVRSKCGFRALLYRGLGFRV